MHRSTLTLVSALVLAAGATRPAALSAQTKVRGGTAADTAAINAAARELSAAYLRRDADAIMRLYTTDGMLLPPRRESVRGHDAIRRYWTQAEGDTVTVHRTTSSELTIEGRYAYDVGTYEIAGKSKDRAWGPTVGKYVIVWRRESDGRWRMYLDMWSTNS